MLNGAIAWWEIQVPDTVKAVEFYSAVFGATTSEWGPYVMLQDESGAPFGAIQQVDAAVEGDGPLATYFPTEDLEATLATIRKAGGTVEKERELISEDFGWWALARDPFGNRLGLCTSQPAAD